MDDKTTAKYVARLAKLPRVQQDDSKDGSWISPGGKFLDPSDPAVWHFAYDLYREGLSYIDVANFGGVKPVTHGKGVKNAGVRPDRAFVSTKVVGQVMERHYRSTKGAPDWRKANARGVSAGPVAAPAKAAPVAKTAPKVVPAAAPAVEKDLAPTG